MKRSAIIFSLIAFFWGCEKMDSEDPLRDNDRIESEVPDNMVVDSLQTDYVLPEILYASVSAKDGETGHEGSKEEPQTRTYVDNNKVLWQNGDAISFFAGNTHNARYTYAGEDGLSSVELKKDNENPGATGIVLLKSQAVYPYNESITVIYDEELGINKINLTYPTTQTYALNSFGKDANIMVAAGSHNADENLNFSNACGYLIIKLYGTGTNGNPTCVKSITLSSVSGVDKIAGSAEVVASNNSTPVITMADDASTAVTLDCSNGGAGIALGADAENATEFWFCLPPVSFTGGIKITVTDIYDNSYTKQTTKTVNITRNDIQPMAALEFVSNTPSATKLWYTRADNNTEPLNFYDGKTNPFNAQISAHEWDPELGKMVIKFSSPLTTIQTEAFRDTDLTTITIPEGVTTIEEGAFRNTPLTEITIPGSVNNVGIDVFWDCASLSRVTFLPSETKTPLNIGYTISASDADGPFYYSPLTTINLNRDLVLTNDDGDVFTPNDWGEGLFANKHYDEEAYKNQGVTVTLGNQVTTLSNYMFYGLPIQTLTIPGTVNTIGSCVFDECEALTSLTYEPSPTGTPLTHGFNDDTDADGPFYASPLSSVIIDRDINYTFTSAETPAEGLFGNKSSLTSGTLGEQVRTLSPYMFANAAIAELVIPGAVTTIQNDVFRGCTQLATLTFEPSPTGTPLTMGYDTDGEDENLFQDNNKLATLNLNREIIYTLTGVDTPSEGLFGGMPTLTSVTLGEQVKTLHKYMFVGSGITSLDLNKVETIDDLALAGVGFTEVTIPATLTTIGNNVFDDCASLATLTFEESETPLEIKGQGNSDGPFYDSPLTTINYNRNFVYKKVNGEDFIPSDASDGIFAISESAKSKVTGKSVVNIGKLITTIPEYMCNNLAITELTIPSTVENVGIDAFWNCDRLSTVTIQDDTRSLNFVRQSYSGLAPFCHSPLTNIYLGREVLYNGGPNNPGSSSGGIFSAASSAEVDEVVLSISSNVQTISPYMFAHLKLKSITIPASITSIGVNAFVQCQSLNSIVFEDSNTPLTVCYHHTLNVLGPFHQSPLTSITLGRNIDYVDSNGEPFTPSNSNQGLFTGEDTVESFSITLKNNVHTISEYMFAGRPITQLNIPASVTEIKAHAFQSCTALSSLTIPGTVNTIGNDVFNECTSLASITFEPSKTSPATPLTLGYNTEGEEDGPFLDSPLTSVNLNREINYTLASIDLDYNDEGIFSGRPLTDGVTIGEQVKTFSNYMFSCSGITSLTIPANVTSIGLSAFENCDYLNTVNFAAGSDTITIACQDGEWGTFYDSPLTSVTLGREVHYVNKNGQSFTPDTSNEGLFTSEDTVQSLSVTLTNNVKTISEYMFAKRPVQEITIPGSVTKIANFAFDDCSKLESISFESGDTDLHIGFQDHGYDKGPFYDSPLRYIYLNRDMVYDYDDLDAKDEGIFSYSFNNTETLNGEAFNTVVEFGNKVKNILPYMFSGVRITSPGGNTADLTIPENITSIGAYAFADSKTLKSIKLMHTSTLPTLDPKAFDGCSYLKRIVIYSAIPTASLSGTAWNDYISKITRW